MKLNSFKEAKTSKLRKFSGKIAVTFLKHHPDIIYDKNLSDLKNLSLYPPSSIPLLIITRLIFYEAISLSPKGGELNRSRIKNVKKKKTSRVVSKNVHVITRIYVRLNPLQYSTIQVKVLPFLIVQKTVELKKIKIKILITF